jgi:hypothetical protein
LKRRLTAPSNRESSCDGERTQRAAGDDHADRAVMVALFPDRRLLRCDLNLAPLPASWTDGNQSRAGAESFAGMSIDGLPVFQKKR